MHETHYDDSSNMHETSSFSLRTLPINVDNEVDDMYVIRSYHDKGIWKNIVF